MILSKIYFEGGCLFFKGNLIKFSVNNINYNYSSDEKSLIIQQLFTIMIPLD